MAKPMFSKYALGITAAAMMTIPVAGIAGATSISPNGSTSDSGSNSISTVTDITTPAPASAEVTLDEITLDRSTHEAPDPAPRPAEENSEETSNTLRVGYTIYAVFMALVCCVYFFMMRAIS